MGKKCEVSGKKTSFGNHITTRGKAKYLGGVGTKVTGVSKRKFKPNLQSMQIVQDGAIGRAKVCVQCIRSGKVARPQKRKPFTMPSL
jgi:large subunit ribosomal protein L28